ncbi:MAG: metalloregulator ArsR/SmtB family transcription factor [Bacillota bacterium]|nr:metalloregulator ArsR/SmtB family transcription factor [Bacillota bacterium]MDW7676368.1 metalloregulator ArsR/SmtB family transcription factor [Bacillota bacterium]
MSISEMSPTAFQEEADLLKAMGHPIRLCILKGLSGIDSCNVSHMQACLSVPQSTLSQHLGVLRNAGIVSGQRNGPEVNYRITDNRVCHILSLLFPDPAE